MQTSGKTWPTFGQHLANIWPYILQLQCLGSLFLAQKACAKVDYRPWQMENGEWAVPQSTACSAGCVIVHPASSKVKRDKHIIRVLFCVTVGEVIFVENQSKRVLRGKKSIITLREMWKSNTTTTFHDFSLHYRWIRFILAQAAASLPAAVATGAVGANGRCFCHSR